LGPPRLNKESRIRLEFIAMLERALCSGHCGRWMRFVTCAALAAVVARPSALAAQQPTAPQPATPRTHTVKRGDTLWDLAKLYLGDAFLWPAIYRLNTDQIEDPHWIYPGEVLKLPSDSGKIVASATLPPPSADTTRISPPTVVAARIDTAQIQPVVVSTPTIVAVAPDTTDTTATLPQINTAQPRPVIRLGEYVASPWVDRAGGPRGSGYIIQSAELPGIPRIELDNLSLYTPIFVSPPSGTEPMEHERFLAYRLGPLVEGLGQIVIPTAIIEVTKAPAPGEATTARVLKMFDEVKTGQRLVRYDTTAAAVYGTATAVENGTQAKVRWIYNEPVQPSLQSYIVLDMSHRDGVNPGDQIELYQPRRAPTDGRPLTLPEVSIAHAQVLRVTDYGATAIVTAQEQPKIEEGTAARIAAKMP
jgi:LysM domain-containing protein